MLFINDKIWIHLTDHETIGLFGLAMSCEKVAMCCEKVVVSYVLLISCKLFG